MVLHNPNNWHWVDKDVSSWTTDHLRSVLTGLSANENGVDVSVREVVSVEGDADVCQRKGKVITLFDLNIKLAFTGVVGEVEKEGSIVIPEVTQDSESVDDLTFDITVDGESEHPKESEQITQTIRRSLAPQVASRLTELRSVLIQNHGGDIQHGPGESPCKNFPKAKVHDHGPAPAAKATSSKPQTASSGIVNVTSITSKDEFRTTAEELFKTFTSPDRIAAFTRSAPRRFDGPVLNGEFELFDGNVSGKFVELDEPRKIVQNWRLAQWPAGHYSTMTIKFDQNDSQGVTTLNLDWKGVPIGHEDTSERNWDEYYIKSIKKTFGFGTVL